MLVCGTALLPKSSSLYERFRAITCVLEVDRGRIVDVEFSTATALTNTYLKRLMVGYDLHQGIGSLVEQITANCLLDSEKAFMRSLANAYLKWYEHTQSDSLVMAKGGGALTKTEVAVY